MRNKPLPKLDERLTVLAQLVRDGVRCADIGTDHGHLITWLAATGKITYGYACDIHKKPLEKAAFSLSAYEVTHLVKLILCDGLSGLSAGDADDFILAGMGGELIWSILDAQPWTRDPNLRFLLQPMTKPERLRQSLYRHGFCILSETPVVSGDFPYSILEVMYTGIPKEIDLTFAYTGLLLEQQGKAVDQYLEKTKRLIAEKLDGMSKASKPDPLLKEYQHLYERLESRNQYDSTRGI